MFKLNQIEKQISKMQVNDNDPLNVVRAKFLIHSVIACLAVAFFSILTFYFSFAEKPFLLYRSISLFIVLTGLLFLLLYTSKWKIAAHISCIVLTIFIWSNIFLVVKEVNILSIQFTLLLIVLSYYLLGSKWGIIYSMLIVCPMTLYFALGGQDFLFTDVKREAADRLTFTVVFVFNFILIIYLQYHFFNAFNNTIRQLNEKQRAENLLNQKLQETLVLAEESANAKSNFLSTISHELRTPLNSVIGMSDILLMENPREDQEENLTILKFSATNLLNLINNVLDFNKIESGKVELENIPFKIADLLRNIYAGFRNKAEEKGLILNLSIDKSILNLIVVGDPTRLTQILINLLENALKFTSTGSVSLQVNLLSHIDDQSKIKFVVNDSGIGIQQDKQQQIFDSFTQSSSTTTRKYGGTGLGLAIVKNLLHLMGSKIEMISELGKGTQFTFELDYQILDYPHQLTDSQAQEEIDISNLRILIAEDNEMNTLLMKKLLATWKITPHFAENGREAINAVLNNDYDLILMDIHMPIMDGYEATIQIRQIADEVKSKIPIIALTASVALDVTTRASAVGIDDFMSKPFNTAELKRKLEEIVIKKR